MLKKIPSDEINDAKNACFFLSLAPIHHSFTFNLRFLYELKHKVRLTKTVGRGGVPFFIPFCFYQSLYFCSAKCMDSFTLKSHNFFQN